MSKYKPGREQLNLGERNEQASLAYERYHRGEIGRDEYFALHRYYRPPINAFRLGFALQHDHWRILVKWTGIGFWTLESCLLILWSIIGPSAGVLFPFVGLTILAFTLMNTLLVVAVSLLFDRDCLMKDVAVLAFSAVGVVVALGLMVTLCDCRSR